ncbi:MAG: hypothetical protein AAF487_06875 [Bacteroidota bacterium]
MLLFLTFGTLAIAQVEDDPDADEEDSEEFRTFNNADYRGFYIGGNVGVYFANKSTATFYSGNELLTPNSVCVFLGCAGNNGIPQVYNQLVEELGGYDFELAEFAQEMNYNPAISLGMNLRYRTGPFMTIQTDLNYVNLRANGILVYQIDRPNPDGSLGDYFESHPIWGEEQRFILSPGVQMYLSDPSDFVPYIDLGAVLTSTRARENRFSVGNRQYSILRPTQNANGTIINNRQATANGFGFYSGIGVNVKFEKVILDFGYRASFEKVPFRKLDEEFSMFDERTLHHAITLKFLYAK